MTDRANLVELARDLRESSFVYVSRDCYVAHEFDRDGRTYVSVYLDAGRRCADGERVLKKWDPVAIIGPGELEGLADD